jgi:nitroreductase
LRVLARYEAEAGYDELVATVVNVLTAYQSFNALHGVAVDELDELLAAYRQKYPQISGVTTGGTVPLTRDEIKRVTDFDFEAFAFARHSVRNYAPDPVAPELIERAVRVAQRAPSVCNRQAGRAHVYMEKPRVDEILSYQLGHRGFGHTVPCVMVITADLQSYYKPGERFQGWVDGGLFTMSLIFGLHAQGLGTCCLNWNVTRVDDLPMRAAAGIPDNEVVITMLAVGHLPDEIRVAESPRRPIDEVLIYG